MDEIVFVTHNKGKIASAERSLKGIRFITYDYVLEEPRSYDLKEIVTAKVKQAYEMVQRPCIALDSGFFIEELNGFPRAFVNFALETIGIKGILKLMEGKINRKCSFKECLAYHDGKKIRYFWGESKGNLTEKIIGKDREDKWSALWYIFVPEGYQKTLAQMAPEERQAREYGTDYTDSMKDFAKWYKENMEGEKSK